jgi:hypothetical protein
MNDDPLLPEEQARLTRARVSVTPPRGDEDRLVDALRERGHLRRRRWARAPIWSAAAAAVLAAVVWAIWPAPERSATVARPRFVLLLYAGTDAAPSAAGSRRREYEDWARDVASRGVPISGEELADESRTLGAAAASADPEPRGFFIISVSDVDAAHQIAATCPHLRYGGRIVIRRVAGT